MNFVKHIIRPLLPEGNTWAGRVEYIVTYYTFRALQRLKNYCKNNDDVVADTEGISEIEDAADGLFQSKFRNCMMHYDLENQGVLTLEYIDQPFYGIVENCFDGKGYQTYLDLIHDLSDQIISYLEKHFCCAGIELKQL